MYCLNESHKRLQKVILWSLVRLIEMQTWNRNAHQSHRLTVPKQLPITSHVIKACAEIYVGHPWFDLTAQDFHLLIPSSVMVLSAIILCRLSLLFEPCACCRWHCPWSTCDKTDVGMRHRKNWHWPLSLLPICSFSNVIGNPRHLARYMLIHMEQYAKWEQWS